MTHPLLKATLTGFRKTYLRFLVFRPKLGETKRFPPILVHMNGKIFLGGSRFPSAKIDLKLAVGGSRSHNNGQEQYWKLIILDQKDDTFRHQWTKNYVSEQIFGPRCQIFESRCQILINIPNIGQNTQFLLLSSSQKIRLAISRERKGLPEIRWYQNDQNFEGFSDFPKN